jgi:hypothetical protein
MTWEEFTQWQSWDEFPELSKDPPITTDVDFSYNGKTYKVDELPRNCATKEEPEGYYIWEIVDNNLIPIVRCDKFIDVLNAPVLHGKSFKELIEELDIDD